MFVYTTMGMGMFAYTTAGMGMFVYITTGMGWEWEYGHGNGREWDRISHFHTSLINEESRGSSATEQLIL